MEHLSVFLKGNTYDNAFLHYLIHNIIGLHVALDKFIVLEYVKGHPTELTFYFYNSMTYMIIIFIISKIPVILV